MVGRPACRSRCCSGPVWKAISPVRTINLAFAQALRRRPRRAASSTYPERLGHWPAAVGLFAFVWMELVYPHATELGPVRLWCAVYVAVMLHRRRAVRQHVLRAGRPVRGLLQRWSPGCRSGAGATAPLVVRSPLANLDTVPVRPGLVAVVAVLFGSTAFDSFKDSTPLGDVRPGRRRARRTCSNNLGPARLLRRRRPGLRGRLHAHRRRRRTCAARELPNLFAHSVVPIIVGYIVAHYLTYLVEVGQQTLIQASDPLSNGSNLFGTGDLERQLLALLPPDAAGHHQGARGRRRPRASA